VCACVCVGGGGGRKQKKKRGVRNSRRSKRGVQNKQCAQMQQGGSYRGRCASKGICPSVNHPTITYSRHLMLLLLLPSPRCCLLPTA
jgi:hypothetical protein